MQKDTLDDAISIVNAEIDNSLSIKCSADKIFFG